MANNYAPKWQSRAVPFEPLRSAVSRFHQQTLLQLKANAITQAVFPTEVYPGYAVINKARELRGEWHSTGRGAKEIDGRVVSADEESNVTVQFDVLNYMRYVDLGVGQGTTAEEVERSRKAHFKRRYEKHWSARDHRRHRPFLMMELRHLERRLGRYLLDFYGYQANFKIMPIFEGMKLDVSPV